MKLMKLFVAALFFFQVGVSFSQDDENWMKHTLLWLEDDKVKIDYRPVHMYTLTDEVDVIPPKKRVY